MPKNPLSRQDLARSYLRRLWIGAAINIFVYAIIAFIVLLLGPRLLKVNDRGIYSELFQYCQNNYCLFRPATVSAVYVLQGAYSAIFIVAISVNEYRRKFKLSSVVRTSRYSLVCLAVVGLVTFVQRFGFEKRGFFSNYVHMNGLYLLQPAMIMLVACLVVHYFSLGNQLRSNFADE